jgi:molybdopterin synthase catalytic subunit/molybdopterin synthase sulfur carrier subunit
MKLEVRLFARARDAAGAERITLELPAEARVQDLKSALASQCPPLASMAPSLLVAVDADYADEATLINPRSEIACFPPVSGG